MISIGRYICDVCGERKSEDEMAGRCFECARYVCNDCAETVDDKVYCEDHAPKSGGFRIGCFIATAAYGTPMTMEIDVLRRFRDRKLNPNALGKTITKLYYGASPPFANVISRSNRMRAFVRFSLKPLLQRLRFAERDCVN